MKFQSRPLGLRCLVACLSAASWFVVGSATNLLAQGFQPPSPEESFRRMDQNGNGQIDPDEIQRLPSFIRDMYTRSGVDVSRPISQQQFMDISQKMREQFEQMRSSGGGFSFRSGGPPGSGGPPSMQGPPPVGESGRSFGSRPEEGGDRDARRDDGSDRRRREEEANSSRSSSSSSKTSKSKKPKVKLTKDLPDDYRLKDKNGDGQVGLYEWDRKLFAQFYELDRNSDGFLTADEVIPPTAKSKSSKSTTIASYKLPTAKEPASSTSATVSATTISSSGNSPVSISKSATPDNPQAVTAFTGLDVNKDGQITEDEWARSRNTRRMFEKANITVTLPIKQTQFMELYSKTQAQ